MAALQRYPALQPGDKIRIVTPASPIEPERVAKSIAFFKEWGYDVELGKHVYDRFHYMAGTDQDRAKDLMDAFLDDSVRCVFCSRGGYGCSRLLPYLDFKKMAASGKLLGGYSDITVLHSALNRRGLPTLHCPMSVTVHYERDQWVYESLRGALAGEFPQFPDAPKPVCTVPGSVKGISCGGCVILLADSIGTEEEINAEDKIIFLEDVDENPHRVDAMLTHLLNAGVFESCAGIVVGEMTRTDDKCDPTIGDWPWREIVKDRLVPLGKPMIMDYPMGHAPNQMSIPLGVPTHLDADRGTVRFEVN